MLLKRDIRLIIRTYKLGSKSDKNYINFTLLFILFAGLSDGLFIIYGANLLTNLLTGVENNMAYEGLGIFESRIQTSIFFLIIVILNFLLRIQTAKMICFSTAKIVNTISTKILLNTLSHSIETTDEDNSSSSISTIALQTDLAGPSAIAPILRAISSTISSIVVLISMCSINFKTTFSASFVVFFFFLCIFLYYKPKLNIISKKFVELKQKLINSLQECYRGLRYIKIYNTTRLEAEGVQRIDRELRQGHARQEYIAHLPRLELEAIIFFSLGFYIFYINLYDLNQNGITEIIVTLGLGGLKILPMVQQTYHGIHSFTCYKESLEKVTSKAKENIEKSDNFKVSKTKKLSISQKNLINKDDFINIKTIELEDISYVRRDNKPVFKNINHTFEKGYINFVKGSSGRGKTTLLDLIMALRFPSNGNILVNNKILWKTKIYENLLLCEHWRRSIGFSGQRPFIKDTSVLNNIFYGTNFDESKDLKEILYFSCLDEQCGFSKEWLQRRCGEQGDLISGGQALRIGIARAILNSKDLLVLDEPTSGLDFKTQNIFFERLTELSKDKIIIMTIHREDIKVSNSKTLYL